MLESELRKSEARIINGKITIDQKRFSHALAGLRREEREKLVNWLLSRNDVARARGVLYFSGVWSKRLRGVVV